MRIDDRLRQYRGLREKNAAWHVLARDNGPLTLAFLGDLFAERADVPMETARTQLVPLLEQESYQDPLLSARSMITGWIDDGLLLEQHQKLMMTSAMQAALQFVNSLSSRDMTATASHLETVNEEMRRLLMTLSPDPEEQQQIIDEQIRSLEAAKQRLIQGRTVERTPVQKREHARHVLQLAQGLTQDFRLLEDEMHRHELAIHQRILDETETRGSVLGGVLDAEELMRQSAAGQAFEGFYALLGDEERSTQFRSQVKRLVSLGVGEFLSADELRFFQHIETELFRQSGRILHRRRSATESLKAYMLSGAQEEHREIDRVLKNCFQKLGQLREEAPIGWKGWRGPTQLTLETGKLLLRSPAELNVTFPDQAGNHEAIEERPASRNLSTEALGRLSGFSLRTLAERTRHTLRTQGSKTIGELAHIQPIKGGIEEVLGLIRLARATGGISLADFEEIYVSDADRGLLKVRVPSVVLRADEFPEDLSELNA